MGSKYRVMFYITIIPLPLCVRRIFTDVFTILLRRRVRYPLGYRHVHLSCGLHVRVDDTQHKKARNKLKQHFVVLTHRCVHSRHGCNIRGYYNILVYVT